MKLKLINSVCALSFLFTILLNVLIQETAAESLESSITPLDTLKDNFEPSALLKKELIFQQSPCDCGVNSTKCEIVDGVKKCECRNNFYDNGGNCVACDCGVGSYGCSMKGGNKACDCLSPYKQRSGKCEWCDCGVNSYQCSFNETGEKQCQCIEGFGMSKSVGECFELCDAAHPCQNGGTCPEGGACDCPDDYMGAWCEIPKWCVPGRCGYADDVTCDWDKENKTGICKCKKEKYQYVEKTRECVECDCGENGDCFLQDGMKVCVCNELYADNFHKCETCNCGKGRGNCSFAEGQMRCYCEEGYSERVYKNKYGYVDNWCSQCSCGEHGLCRYYDDSSVCDCEDGYISYSLYCYRCNCGPHGFCALGYEQGVGYVENCTCDYGYSVLNGKCEPCSCDPPGVKNIGATCKLWSLEQHTCYCPDGFISDQDDICEDIDECKNASACGSNTVCVNLPGSYRCDCKVGYEPLAPEADISIYGCKDIDECFNSSICVFSTTECINSPGSFDCKCKKDTIPHRQPSMIRGTTVATKKGQSGEALPFPLASS